MKTLNLVLLILCILGIYSCQKNEPSFDFYVKGIADVAFDGDSSVSIPLEIIQISGKSEKISLELNDIPSKVAAKLDTQSGIPNYKSVLTLTGLYADSGTHTTILTATSASGLKKTYPFTVKVKLMKDCTKVLVGSYNNTDCYGRTITSEVSKISANRLRIGMYSAFNSVSVNATINCDLKTILIDTTILNTYPRISGSGTFSGKTITINYHIQTMPTTSTDCIATMTKQ